MKALIAALALLASFAVQAQKITAPQVNSDWNASSGVAQVLNKPSVSTVASTGNFADLIGKPSTLSGYGITDGVTSSALTTALGSYATTSALTSGLATKFAIPTGTTSQYVRGDGSIATLPVATAFNFGAPNNRTLSVSTDYQATDTTKAAVFTISPSCGASITLTTGSTCTVQARIASAAVTCSTGTVVATWTNGNTGTLTVGLALTQTIGSPGDVHLPISWHLMLCPVSGTFSISAVDQSAG